ncbi:MAG: hypothetical protein J6B37_00430 [Clostridia bacterium]|nr:hypothetical protein [Clostridia bacterium]
MDKDFEYYESLPKPELSVRARKRLNRLFREMVGSSKIPHPEVDNLYERVRSLLVRKVKVLIFKIKEHK